MFPTANQDVARQATAPLAMPARVRNILLVAVGIGVIAWAWLVAANNAVAAAPLTAKASSATTANSQVKATVKIVVTAPRSGSTKKARVAVAKGSKPAKKWRGKTRNVTLRWARGAYRGTVTVRAKKRPKVTVKASVGGKVRTVVVKAPHAKKPVHVVRVPPVATTILGTPPTLAVTARNPGTITAAVYPSFGRSVHLQEFNPRSRAWVTIDRVTTRKSAMVTNVSFGLPPRAAGTSQWRVRAVAVPGMFVVQNSSTISVTTDLGTGPLRGVTTITAASALDRPLVIAHRGGADRYPELSREAYAAAATAGFVIEADLRALSDGTPALLHDATTTRTIIDAAGKTVDREINTLTPAQWTALRIRPAYDTGAPGTPLTWAQALDEFGGRAIIAAEVKTASLARRAVDDIADRGLADSVILQSNSQSVVAAMTDQAQQRGITIHIRRLLSVSFFAGTPAQITAGLTPVFGNEANEWLGASLTQTNNYLLPHAFAHGHDARRVIPYSVTTPNQVDYLLTLGLISGFSSDDPWFVWSNIAAAMGH